MSDETRQTLVAKLMFTDDTQKGDLLDENITNTWLIQMLEWLVDNCAEQLEILAVRTDHPTPDGAWAHSGGLAVDLYPANWAGREQEAVINVFEALKNNPYCWEVGFGGVTQQWQTYVTWPNDGKFGTFNDNNLSHIHIDAANADGGPGDRLT